VPRGARAAEHPGGRLAAVFADPAAREGAHRLLANDEVDLAALQEAMFASAVSRSSAYSMVFVAQDQSSLAYTGEHAWCRDAPDPRLLVAMEDRALSQGVEAWRDAGRGVIAALGGRAVPVGNGPRGRRSAPAAHDVPVAQHPRPAVPRRAGTRLGARRTRRHRHSHDAPRNQVGGSRSRGGLGSAQPAAFGTRWKARGSRVAPGSEFGVNGGTRSEARGRGADLVPVSEHDVSR